jgi:SAM-dependent methyltransferase
MVDECRHHCAERYSYLNVKSGFSHLWRHHSDSVNRDLLARWLPADCLGTLLKTDLFDEALAEGLHAVAASHAERFIGIDISFPVIEAARIRYPTLQAIGADVRHLPFADAAFDVIISNSTLDHLPSKDEIALGLREFHRVLRTDGLLLLTIDNLANPLVALRNALPFSWLYRLGVVPYYIGTACRPAGLRAILEDAGLKVLELDAVMHCPRVLAVAAAQWIEKHATLNTQRRFLAFMRAFECLACLPTRFITGYFIAAKMVKQ